LDLQPFEDVRIRIQQLVVAFDLRIGITGEEFCMAVALLFAVGKRRSLGRMLRHSQTK
jgi:hypothetical protein